MAFKDVRTGYYKTEKVLPGYGRLRRISLGTKRRDDADALERAIVETHRRALYDPSLLALLDGLQGRGRGRSGRVAPQDLLLATRHPDGPDVGLARLLRSLDDPPLRDVADDRRAELGREGEVGLPEVVAAAEAEFGPRCPVSVLRDAAGVEAVLRRAEADTEKLPASVARWEKRAVSKLLRLLYGRAERDRVMGDVQYSGGDDRRRLRESVVTSAAVARLVDEVRAGYWKPGDELAPLLVKLAASTGGTVRPLADATVGQWNAAQASLYLAGTKRAKKGGGGRRVSRDRDVRVPAQLVPEVDAAAALARAARPDDPAAPLFPIAYSRFYTLWRKAVTRAGLEEAVLDGRGERTHLTPHDLRRIYSLFGRRAGLSREKIGQGGLGHDRLETTDRYIRSETSIDAAEASAVFVELGL